jgi:hypothetical protein
MRLAWHARVSVSGQARVQSPDSDSPPPYVGEG